MKVIFCKYHCHVSSLAHLAFSCSDALHQDGFVTVISTIQIKAPLLLSSCQVIIAPIHLYRAGRQQVMRHPGAPTRACRCVACALLEMCGASWRPSWTVRCPTCTCTPTSSQLQAAAAGVQPRQSHMEGRRGDGNPALQVSTGLPHGRCGISAASEHVSHLRAAFSRSAALMMCTPSS